MEKQWFVLHTLSGQEQKVKDSIERRAKLEEMDGLIGEVLVPTEKVSETKQGKKKTVTKKFFPGYVIVCLCLYDDRKLIPKTWSFIQDTPGVIGFIGGDRPVAMRQPEIDAILQQVEEKKEKVRPKVEFSAGENVKINDGPFQSFTGVIEEVDTERGRLKISVSIFGRNTPVELEYWQVEKV